MQNMGLIKTFQTDAAIEPRKVVTFGAGDRKVVKASAVNQALIGVTNDIGSEKTGRVDIIMSGIVLVTAGADITRGQRLTVNVGGNVVPSTEATDRILGISMESVDSGTVVSVMLAQA
jgi:hypothetical protein